MVMLTEPQVVIDEVTRLVTAESSRAIAPVDP